MVNLKTAKSRAWFFPTSPRSPHKLQGELALLKTLEGKIWNKATQTEFAYLLRDYADFEGNISATDPAFSARDRATRAPRLLGFVEFPKKGTKGAFKFTDAGNFFLSASSAEQSLIFQRQIAKVQFKSPLHASGGREAMTVKPLMVMIRLLLEINTMSKTEVGLFGVTLTDEKGFDARIKEIGLYRQKLAKTDTDKRKLFRQDFATKWVEKIYSEDIAAGHTKVREGGKDFVKTKLGTLNDYADATIRYLRATGLFTVNPNSQRLELSNAGKEDAKFLLQTYGIGLSRYTHLELSDYVRKYLGNPSLPIIRKDDDALKAIDLGLMLAQVTTARSTAIAEAFRQDFENAPSRAARLQILTQLGNLLGEIQVADEAKSIRDNLKLSLSTIGEQYEKIANRQSGVLDKPLMYEWNTWRAMVLINDAKNVQGNYTCDQDGNPVSTAGGNKPDIQVEYESFHLAVEVTLSSGAKQYEMEGESISRHLGNIQKKLIEDGDKRPVFGIFIAEKLNASVVAHLLTQARFSSQLYKGSIRIVPMSRRTFQLFMESAVSHRRFTHRVLKTFFENSFSKKSIEMGELDWVAMVDRDVVGLRELVGN